MNYKVVLKASQSLWDVIPDTAESAVSDFDWDISLFLLETNAEFLQKYAEFAILRCFDFVRI